MTKPNESIKNRQPTVLKQNKKLLAIFIAASPFLSSCSERRMFFLNFPDAAFIFNEDWIQIHQRVQNFSEFDINIPRKEIPKKSLDLRREISGETGLDSSYSATYDVHIEYRNKSNPGEIFQERVANGLTPLPDVDSDFRKAVKGDKRYPNVTIDEVYEIKASPQYAITCFTYTSKNGRQLTKKCGMQVPYQSTCDANKCTMISVAIPPNQLRRWAEFAEGKREAIRRFETKPNLEQWNSREAMRRDILNNLVKNHQ